jgi:hypothetical protein
MNENLTLFQNAAKDVVKKNPKIFNGYYFKPANAIAPLTLNYNSLNSNIIDAFTLESYIFKTFQYGEKEFEHKLNVDNEFMQKVYPDIIDYEKMKSFIKSIATLDENKQDFFRLSFRDNELININFEAIILTEFAMETINYKVYHKDYASNPLFDDIQSVYELDFLFNFPHARVILTGKDSDHIPRISDSLAIINEYKNNKEKYFDLFQMSKI